MPTATPPTTATSRKPRAAQAKAKVRWGSTVERIALAEIYIRPEFNPRLEGAVDVEELAASILAQGLLQPLLVSPREEGGYWLVAGHRRHAALELLGQTETIVTIREFDAASATEAALVENLQREDLTPIDEARAYHRMLHLPQYPTQDAIAKAIGKPAARISQRLQLLELPDDTQTLIHDGKLPVTGTGVLAKIAAHAPQLAQHLGEQVAAGELTADRLQTDPGFAVATNVRRSGVANMVHVDDSIGWKCPLPNVKAYHGVIHRYDALGWSHRQNLTWSDDDLNAARAYGCLLELGKDIYLTDLDWIADRLDQKLGPVEELAAKTTADESDDLADRAKAKRDREEQRVELERLVQARNKRVGVEIAKRFHAVELAEAVEVIIDALEASEFSFDAVMALRLVDDGTLHAPSKEACDGALARPLSQWLRRGQTPERRLAMIVQFMIAMTLATNSHGHVPWSPLRDDDYELRPSAAKLCKGWAARLPKVEVTS